MKMSSLIDKGNGNCCESKYGSADRYLKLTEKRFRSTIIMSKEDFGFTDTSIQTKLYERTRLKCFESEEKNLHIQCQKNSCNFQPYHFFKLIEIFGQFDEQHDVLILSGYIDLN